MFPALHIETVCYVILPLLLGLSNIGGVGGGYLTVPITIAMLGFNATQAIAISNSTIFCGAVVRYFFFSIYQRHPKLEGRTMIDYNIVSIMIPNVLIGAYFGIML